MFLRISSFIDDDFGKNKLVINPYSKRNILDLKSVESRYADLSENEEAENPAIPNHKLIRNTDYLITLRGRPKGFSMLKSIEPNHPKLASSNHFIHIRPRQTQIESMHIPYLHLLLDILVEKKIYTIFEEKKKNEDTLGRKYSAYNSFRIQDLRDMKISILKNIEDQKRVFDLFEKKYDELLSANLNIESFVNCLSVKSIK
jgi:hypothetical protein